MDLPVQPITAMPFWLRLEYEAEESTENGNPDVSSEVSWRFSAGRQTKSPFVVCWKKGPLRLSDMPRTTTGTRGNKSAEPYSHTPDPSIPAGPPFFR
jgi:hypothetical protein